VERGFLRAKVVEVYWSPISAGARQYVLCKSYPLSCSDACSTYQWNTQRCHQLLQLLTRPSTPYTTTPPTTLSCVTNRGSDVRNVLSPSTTSQIGTCDEVINVRLLSLARAADGRQWCRLFQVALSCPVSHGSSMAAFEDAEVGREGARLYWGSRYSAWGTCNPLPIMSAAWGQFA